MGQAIDPSIFTDEDGTSYLLFGNGSAAIAQLNDDMMSIKEGTLKQINGLTDFRESVVVTKVDGKYHWTWSCDDANSPNYHVNYGVICIYPFSSNVISSTQVSRCTPRPSPDVNMLIGV